MLTNQLLSLSMNYYFWLQLVFNPKIYLKKKNPVSFLNVFYFLGKHFNLDFFFKSPNTTYTSLFTEYFMVVILGVLMSWIPESPMPVVFLVLPYMVLSPHVSNYLWLCVGKYLKIMCGNNLKCKMGLPSFRKDRDCFF